MKIELIEEFDPELVFFTVDGREIEVPKELHFHSAHPSNFTTHFGVVMAVDRATKEPVSDEIRAALAKYIEEGCTKDRVKFKVITE